MKEEVDMDFSDASILPLNHSSSSGKFLYDNRVVNAEISNYLNESSIRAYIEAKNRNNTSNATSDEDREYILNFDSMLVTHREHISLNIKVVQNTNIGIRKEDLFKVYVLESQNLTDQVRSLIDPKGKESLNSKRIQSSMFQYDMQEELVKEYKFSSEVGTLNFERSILNSKQVLDDKQTFMEQRNLKEHAIFLSIPEFYDHQPYLLDMRKQAPRVFSTFIDESVVMINQIMFTFYKNYIFAVDVKTSETWFWTTTNFMISNRTLKYDYNDSLPIMIVCEFVLRIVAFFKILLAFGFISIVNALIIRLTIKCSIVVMFWYLALEEHCMRNGINYNHRSHIYR